MTVGWDAARELAYRAAAPLPPAAVPLADAEGCTLAAPLRAASPVPGFDCSAMDGYAVGSPTGPWRIVGRVLAGDRPGARLGPGEAVHIATGAPTPVGTYAVLPDEDADLDPAAPAPAAVGPGLGGRGGPGDGGGLGGLGLDPLRDSGADCGLDPESGRPSFGRLEDRGVPLREKVDGGPLTAGRHVRLRGEDVPLDVDLLPAGTRVTPTVVGLAAQAGLETLLVRRRPTVAALLTGAELVSAGGSRDGLVRDGVGPALPGWVRALGGAPLPLHFVAEDGTADLVAAVTAAGADVVVTSGGAGGGPADRVVPALLELGATLVVDRVDCRPGRPMRLAALPDGRWWVALPGSPYAGLVAVLTLLGPLLAGLAGRPLPVLPSAGIDGVAPRPDGPRTRIVPVRWAGAGVVTPAGPDRPGQLWGAAAADAHAVLASAEPGDGALTVRLLTF